MWPVHTWLPDAHVEAPTGGSVVLAAIMPSSSARMASCASRCRSCPTLQPCNGAGFIIALSLIAVVYIGFVALVQTDMKKLVAYSSISHMGFRHARLFHLQFELGIEPAALVQMISATALFLPPCSFASACSMTACIRATLPTTAAW